MAINYGSPLPALVALGVLSHLAVFIRIDSISRGPLLGLTLLITPPILYSALCYFMAIGYIGIAITTAKWYGCYVAGVLLSMLIYRVFFHRLRHYPGPFIDRLTQLAHVWHVSKRIDHYKRLDQLHKQYGEFVRVGPNMLSVADPTIVNIAHGQTSKFTKGNFYEVAQPLTSLHQMTDPPLHDRRRRHGWDKAFTASALRSYDSRITKYTNKLVQQLRQRAGEVVNAQEWIGFFAFDVMGDLAFGRSFDALERGESHWFIDAIRANGLSIGFFNTTPWVLELVLKMPIPALKAGIVQLLKFSGDLVNERKKLAPTEPDVMSHILEAGKFFDNKLTEELLLTGDARLLVVAGSDTTAAVLTHILYYLALDSTIADKLRAELAEHNLHNSDSLGISSLVHLPYLNAVINETMRLHPPVPGGVQRVCPEGGVVIDGHFIPEGCVVLSPQYTIQRSPKAFDQPDEHIPERWTTRPELILDRSAFFPFLIGRYGCIGKQLAYNEMRNVVSRMVLEFDVAFAKGEDGRRLLEETQDHFTMGLAGLDLVFTNRN